MNADELRAAYAEAKKLSRQLLDRDGCRAEQSSAEAAPVVPHDEPTPHRMSLEARRQRMEGSEQARRRANVERRERVVQSPARAPATPVSTLADVEALVGGRVVTPKSLSPVLDELRQLREELGQLRADIEIQRHHGRAEIIDLPPLPLRNQRHA